MSKKRLGFVSNSSSVSFLCEVCGHLNGGYDACMSDFGFAKCINGHVICDHHKFSLESIDIPIEIMKKALLDSNYAVEEDLETISLKELKDKYQELLDDSDNYDFPSEICPLCQHTEITQKEIVEYFVHTFHVDMKDTIPLIKEYLVKKDAEKNK
jgi:hypothetical protein